MNLLLLYPDEVVGEQARIVGDRAKWVRETFALKIGDTPVCGILAGRIGEAKILSVEASEIVAQVNFTKDPSPRLPGEIIVGLSRPQTIKKVLHFSASVGIETVRFVECEGSEKSYGSSHILRPDDLAAELDLGLCQGVDTVRPEVIIHRNFAACIKAFAAGKRGNAATKWVGDLSGGSTAVGNLAQKQTNAVDDFAIAIGPEKGFSSTEITALHQAGFESKTLGTRQLRVEFALAGLVGAVLAAS